MTLSETIILSSPESVLSQNYSTRVTSKSQNVVSSRIKSDILSRVAEEMYKYKAYPEDAHFCVEASLFERTWLIQWLETVGNNDWRTKWETTELSSICMGVQSCAWDPRLLQMLSLLKWTSPSCPIGETLESPEKEKLELLKMEQYSDMECEKEELDR